MYKKRVQDAVNAIKNGEMIIIMDDEDRENEGDLVMAGIFSTPQKINFMAQEACGLICVCITDEMAKRLNLPLMVEKNDSNHETAFTVSIDAREAKTGISAFERDMTIRLMCDPNATPSDFVRPGHIFPLIAKSGGTLIRTGHTEASVDICRLAGLLPVGVICEIMKKDGTMAKRDDKFLMTFSKEHNLKILYVSDIIQYRLNFENLVQKISSEKAIFMHSDSIKMRFSDHLGRVHSVFAFEGTEEKIDSIDSIDSVEGVDAKRMIDSKRKIHSVSSSDFKDSSGLKNLDSSDCDGSNVWLNSSLKDPPYVKFHTIREDLDLLSNHKDFDELLRAIKKLQKDGGYLIFLQDNCNFKNLDSIDSKQVGVSSDFEGSSKGAIDSSSYKSINSNIKGDSKNLDSENLNFNKASVKNFGVGAQILRLLKIERFRLLSSNTNEYAALSGFNLKLIQRVVV